MSESLHVHPRGDLIEHELHDADCVCGPEVVPLESEDGSIDYIYKHHSLDGRELREHEDHSWRVQ